MLCHDPLLIFPLGSQWVTCVSSYLLLFIACFLISSLVAFAFYYTLPFFHIILCYTPLQPFS